MTEYVTLKVLIDVRTAVHQLALVQSVAVGHRVSLSEIVAAAVVVAERHQEELTSELKKRTSE